MVCGRVDGDGVWVCGWCLDAWMVMVCERVDGDGVLCILTRVRLLLTFVFGGLGRR